MCIRVSSKVLQKEQGAVFVITKVYSFFLRKSTLLRILYSKERKVLSIVAKRGDSPDQDVFIKTNASWVLTICRGISLLKQIFYLLKIK